MAANIQRVLVACICVALLAGAWGVSAAEPIRLANQRLTEMEARMSGEQLDEARRLLPEFTRQLSTVGRAVGRTTKEQN